MENEQVLKLIRRWEEGRPFRVTTIELTHAEARGWVWIMKNPQRFTPAVFAGEWADSRVHPSEGQHGVLSIVSDGTVSRAVIRDGRRLCAYPWL